jgi:uncharacterized protein (TIGR00369 family)
MTREQHCVALQNMYLTAPINDLFHPSIEVGDGVARIEMDVSEQFFHAAGALHGSVYFKMLDDAAFFAANSLEMERFLLTSSFTTYFSRPVSSGRLTSEGRVVNRGRSQFIVEAVLHDSEGNEIGRGSGVFVRSNHRLADAQGYSP